jgi:hypothetical protein
VSDPSNKGVPPDQFIESPKLPSSIFHANCPRALTPTKRHAAAHAIFHEARTIYGA